MRAYLIPMQQIELTASMCYAGYLYHTLEVRLDTVTREMADLKSALQGVSDFVVAPGSTSGAWNSPAST